MVDRRRREEGTEVDSEGGRARKEEEEEDGEGGVAMDGEVR